MRAQVVRHRAAQQGRRRGREFRRNTAGMATDGVLRAWSRRRLTNWKKPSCAASAANSNRRAWLAPETHSKCSRWFAGRKKWGETILAPAGQERNIRSATAREARLTGAPSLSRFVRQGGAFDFMS